MTPRLRASAAASALTVLFTPITACDRSATTASLETPPDNAVASWAGNHVGFADLEAAVAKSRTPACAAARRGAGGGSVEALLPCYREAAEALVLEALLLSEMPDLEGELENLGERYQELRQHAYFEEYVRRLQDSIEVSDADVEAYFEENRGRFQGVSHMTLWNIFRRHQDAAKPEATMAFLSELKERFEAGETFDKLAREYSHSETRLRGGLVGRLASNRLPERLRDVASSLVPGAVSDPIPVRGGAVLLHVTEMVEATDVSVTLDSIRQRVHRQLEAQRIQEAIAARVADLEPPRGATVLAPEQLIAALDGNDGQDVVLEITEPLTADQLRRLAGFKFSQRAVNLDEEGRQRLLDIYRQQQERQLLVVDLLVSAESELRQTAEAHLREEAIDALIDQKIRQEIEGIVDADPERLRQYFADNRLHYQSSLRFQLHIWTLPFGDDPPTQLERMERLQERLARAEISLSAAATELGGTVNSLGWTEFEHLRKLLPGKAVSLILQIGTSGYSIAYQQAKALHVIWLEERHEPRQLDYQEVSDRVRDDYSMRFEQDLFRRLSEGRLAEVGYVFDEEAVRRYLAWPAGAPASEVAEDEESL